MMTIFIPEWVVSWSVAILLVWLAMKAIGLMVSMSASHEMKKRNHLIVQEMRRQSAKNFVSTSKSKNNG